MVFLQNHVLITRKFCATHENDDKQKFHSSVCTVIYIKLKFVLFCLWDPYKRLLTQLGQFLTVTLHYNFHDFYLVAVISSHTNGYMTVSHCLDCSLKTEWWLRHVQCFRQSNLSNHHNTLINALMMFLLWNVTPISVSFNCVTHDTVRWYGMVLSRLALSV
jgi:hypothetical protein